MGWNPRKKNAESELFLGKFLHVNTSVFWYLGFNTFLQLAQDLSQQNGSVKAVILGVKKMVKPAIGPSQQEGKMWGGSFWNKRQSVITTNDTMKSWFPTETRFIKFMSLIFPMKAEIPEVLKGAFIDVQFN